MQGDAEGTRTTVPQTEGRQQHEPRKHPLHDVFVSYSTRDKPVADAIVSRLEQAGVRCWVAPRDVLPGRVWGEAIVEAIKGTRLMVVVLSGEANESRQVVREVERAVAHDVVIIPFRIDSVEPTGAMAYYLASEHWLDAMTPPLEAHISQLVTVVHSLLETTPARSPYAEGPAAPIPVPSGVRRRSRRRLVASLAAAGALVGVGVAAVVLFALPRGHQPRMVSLTQLVPGDCLVTPAAFADHPMRFWESDEPWPSRVGVVPCGDTHKAEVFFVADLWEANARYPGQDAMNKTAFSRCESAFESYVGVSYADSHLKYTMWTPNAASWGSRDRQVGCVAYAPDGEALKGSIKRTFQ